MATGKTGPCALSASGPVFCTILAALAVLALSTPLQAMQEADSQALPPPGPPAGSPDSPAGSWPLSGDIAPLHDPAIILDDGQAHLFSTSHLCQGGGLIRWRTSPDLLHWTARGAVFEELPAWVEAFNPQVRGIWAPDIIHVDGEYRLYYSVSSFGQNLSAIGLAVTDRLDPDTAMWTDRGQVVASAPGDSYNAIDPNILIDQEGRHWMAFGSFWSGIKMIELDPQSGLALKDEPALYALAGRPDPPHAIEAPFIVAREGWYYLFVSFDFCCRRSESTYYTVVGRSRHPTGPYLDRQGRAMLRGGGTTVLAARSEPDGRFVGQGHPAILRRGDDYLIVHHTYDTARNGTPTLRIAPLSWTEDGWPVTGR